MDFKNKSKQSTHMICILHPKYFALVFVVIDNKPPKAT